MEDTKIETLEKDKKREKGSARATVGFIELPIMNPRIATLPSTCIRNSISLKVEWVIGMR